MAETVIFAEQELTLTGSSGIYTLESFPALFVLVEGETYRVVLDGTEHELVCTLDDYGTLGLSHYVLNESGEPTDGTFAIMYGSAEVNGTEGVATAVSVFDSSNTANHTLAIYQIIEDEEPEEPETQKVIVLRDRNGNRVEYPGIERVKLNTTSGETVEFVSPSLIPESVETIIDPDFSGGNIEVTPEDGQAFSKVTVKQPEKLIPSNIAKGVDIAGIIGTLAAGGSGKVAYGVFKPTVKQPNTITHYLGMLPDLVLVCIAPRPYPNKNYSELIFAVSEAFSTLNGGINSNRNYSTTSDYGDTKRNQVDTFVENTFTGSGYGICNANETSFTIRNDLDTAYKYFWIAVAGLT